MNDNKKAALIVVETLRDSGYKALWAGGCVRDMLLNREPKDYDIATDAYPEDVCKLFRRTIEVGAQFGVIIVMIGDVQIEVATFRTEENYVDGRRPEKVKFTDAKEDALRRDFTINGMFYDPVAKEVIDYVGGMEDLGKKLIRTIGEANERFGEDYLRMLRAVRFAAQLDFEIDPQTWQGVCETADNIQRISSERIAMEIENIFACSSLARGMRLFVQSGLAKAVFPSISDEDFEQGLNVLDHVQGSLDIATGLTCFMINLASDSIVKQCKSLKLSNKQYTTIKWLLANRDSLNDSSLGLAQLKILLANEDFEKLVTLEKTLSGSQGESIELLEFNLQRAEKLKGTDLTPKPFLNGNEIMQLGLKPGPELGKISKELYMLQLGEEIRSRQEAVDWIEKHIQSH